MRLNLDILVQNDDNFNCNRHDQIRQMGVHESSMVNLRAGAQRICAEVSMNPRERAVDTAQGRGLSVTACEQMVFYICIGQLEATLTWLDTCGILRSR